MKSILSLFVLTAICGSVLGQNTSWARHLAGKGVPYTPLVFSHTALAPDGSIYQMSEVQDTLQLGDGHTVMGFPVVPGVNVAGTYVTKFAPNGDLRWSFGMGGGAGVFGRGLEVDANGRIYLVVLTTMFTSTNFTAGTDSVTISAPDDGTVLVCLHPDGRYNWHISATGDDNVPLGITALQNGAAIIGTASGNVTFQGNTVSSSSGMRAWVFAFDSTGSYRYGHMYHNASRARIASDADENLYIATTSTGSSTFGTLPVQADEAYVTVVGKTDDAGVPQWVNVTQVDGSVVFGNVGQRAMTVDNNANRLIVVGSFADTLQLDATTTLTPTTVSGTFFYVAAYDLNGNVVWTDESIGPSSISLASDVSVNNAGDIFITGDYYGTLPTAGPGFTLKASGLNLPRVGEQDGFLAKYNSAGTAQWLKGMKGDQGVNYHLSVEAVGPDQAVISGIFSNQITIGDTTFTVDQTTNAGGYVARCDGSLASPSSLGGSAEKSISLFPNPVRSRLLIRAEISGNTVCRIVGATGATQWTGVLVNGNAELDVSEWPSGVYICQLGSGAEMHREKIIIIK